MIQLKINNMDHKAILTVPADYERVILALWTIGLDRDPEKYTLRQLDAEFTYTTEEESQMVRLIDPRSSLKQLHHQQDRWRKHLYRDISLQDKAEKSYLRGCGGALDKQ